MLTARQVVNELQKTGHSVAFIRRADGGIRIYNIDGKTFPRNSSEGNNYAREMLKNEAVAGKSKVPVLKTDYSAKRLDQLKKNRQKNIKHPTTKKSPLQRALEEIRKTKKVIDQLIREGHGKASDFENLATTANQVLNTSDVKVLRSERTRLYLYRQVLRKTQGKPLVDPNEAKSEILGMLYGASLFAEYYKVREKNIGFFYSITKQDLDDLEKAYKAGREDLQEMFTTNEKLAKLLRYWRYLDMEFPITKDYFILKEGDERIKYHVYYYDTETHADRELQASILNDIEKGKRPKTEEAGIWLACTINAESTPENDVFDTSMARVLKRWENMAENENCLIYCFNLSFEWSYLRPYIYKMMKQVDGELTENSFSIVSNVSQSVVYQIKMRFSSKVIKIVDLHRLITGASLGKLAKELKLDVQKGNLDEDEGGVDSYDKMRRLPNYQPTNNEKIYCFRDCWVMKEIIDLKIKEYEDFVKNNPWQWGRIENKKAIKVPTTETEEGKEFFNSVTTASYSCKVMIRETYPRKVIQTKKGEKILTSLSQYRDNYPVLDPEIEKFVRYSYEGGLCFPTFKYGGACSLGRFYHLDVNSQYPSQIDQHELPYGKPKHFYGEPPKIKGYMCLLKIRYKYHELKFIPSLQMTGKPLIWLQKNVNKMIGEDYSNDPVDCDVLYVWDFYIDALKACLVGFEYEVIEGYAFKSKIADFAPYFREHFELKNKYKKEHLDGLKMTEKLLINSPTGKLGEKARNYRLKLEPDEEGWLFNTKEEINEGDKGYRKSAKFTYTPAISAITAWARRFLILTAQRFGFENIAYCDTDSLFVLATPETTELLKDKNLFGKNLMQWDRDLDYLSPTFSKAKNYCGVLDCDDAKLDVKSGGVSEPEPLLSPLMSGLDEETPLKTKSRQMVNTKNGKVMVALTRELSCSVVCYLNKFKTIDYRPQQRAWGMWSDEDDRKVEKALERAYKEACREDNEKTEYVDVNNVYKILRKRMLGV